MNIGLIDVDGGGFPNLCLMKLSAWHKKQGDDVQLLYPEDVLLGSNLFQPHDKLYAACVFTKNQGLSAQLAAIGAEIGGTGTACSTQLPPHIEHICPDYSLYNIKGVAYGFLTRGCPRNCPFCIVGWKEGYKSYKVANLDEFWHGERIIKLLDPNILAAEEHIELLKQLADSGAWIDFTQGLDARLLTRESTDLISSCNVKMLHFAWDNPKDQSVPRALSAFAKRTMITDFRKKRVYVLVNYWSTHEEDLSRIYWLKDHSYDPYVMIYDKPNAPVTTRRLQRWVNNKIIFHSCDRFEDYKA